MENYLQLLLEKFYVVASDVSEAVFANPELNGVHIIFMVQGLSLVTRSALAAKKFV